MTARPPDVLEAGFVVQFYWSGNDADGRVDHYQWKISNNGTDGISLQDTLTFDPVTGDTLNPWFGIVATDSTFLVTADIPDFPNDPPGLQPQLPDPHLLGARRGRGRRHRPHAGLGQLQPATTLLPTIKITGPRRSPVRSRRSSCRPR